MKKHLINIIKVSLLAVAFFFVGKVIHSNWALIKGYSWQPDIFYLVISFILLILTYFMNAFGWYLILRALNVKVPFFETANIWLLSQFARYVPGYVLQFVGRIGLLSEKGVSKKRGLLSIHLESASVILAGILASLISMLLGENGYEGVSFGVVLFSICAGVVLLHPKVLETALNIFFKIMKKERVSVDYDFKNMLLITLYYISLWAVLCTAFFFFVKSLYDIDASVYFNLSFAFTASYVIGFLAIFAPGGIGVREGFLILFLGKTVPKFITPVISVASRIWFVIGELLCFAVIMAAKRVSGGSKRANGDYPDGS